VSGPLDGLRVLELASGVAGPYGGRLLAMLGATVVKVEPSGGDPARMQPIDGRAVADPGPLFVHLNAGKRLVSAGRVSEADAVAWADVVIESRVRAELAGTALEPEHLAPDTTLVTTSPWGFESAEPARIGDELLVQAASGLMGTTGDPDGPPLRFPGFQSQYMAGAYVAAAALAAPRIPARWIDVPWLGAIASGVEGGWSHNLQADRRDPPGGPQQLDVYPSGALPCADGFVVPGTIRPHDWVVQCKVYGRPELIEDERFRSRGRRRRNRTELWRELEPWYASHSRAQIFHAALAEGWALGMVLRGADALADPHLAARGFFDEVALPGGGSVRAPARPWLAPDVRARPVRLASAGADDAWFGETVRAPAARADAAVRQPLRELRVLELTQAWAGPFVGRFLGALGADVVKVESPARPDGWRGPSPFGQMAPHLQRDPEALSVEIGPNFNTINRNKRHCSLDLTTPQGRDTFLELTARADVVVANMTARVLPSLALTYDDLAAVNPRIILVHMPALGATGPFRDAAGYGTIVEGMGGFGAAFGPPEAGARISQTYFPDPVAGLHASLAVLSLLEQRERSGRGGEIDLSHQETLWLQQGEVLIAAARGHEVERIGNGVPGLATSGVFPARDARWIAVASDVPCDDLLEGSAARAVEELLAALRSRRAASGEVLHFADARHDERVSPMLEVIRHEVTGERPYLRVPLIIEGKRIDSRSPTPVFDRHTREVLAEWLGYAPTRIDALLAGEGVGGAPDPEGLRQYYIGRARR
jgi:crotonobetainyl-CoA:carnitine CoA-transferase CaiB-like acyl-CoA transferase